MRSNDAAFTFIDLFAGIGGFHAALSALGGECVYASEIDEAAAKIYQHNWGMTPKGDIVPETDPVVKVPTHDVLAAGFPCQPFSKSGFQRGMDEARGTLFYNICKILEEHCPSIVLLENVRNIAGPRHTHEWDVIIRSLRDLGYRVSSTPAVFSPHLLPPDMGGRPQIRERVFIVGTYVGDETAHDEVEPIVTNYPLLGWDPQQWSLANDILQREDEIVDRANYELTETEQRWVHVWSEFVKRLRDSGVAKLPGFPVWVDSFIDESELVIDPETPLWKTVFLRKNAEFYTRHRVVLDQWLKDFDGLDDLPASRRKFEWQAQDAASLEDCIMHFRPSGIRAKRPTYVPALVAITQTTILGQPLRRITPREAARLQGLPDTFEFPGQPDALTYRQMGNGVNVGVAYHVLRSQMARSGGRWRALAAATPANADEALREIIPPYHA
jgi:DNA (cytosine-5)-methyltransferase 1